MAYSGRLQLGEYLSEEGRRIVQAFRVEADALCGTPVAGQGTNRVLLTVENQYDWSQAGRGRAPPFQGRNVESPSDDDLAAMQRRLRMFVLEKEPTHLLKVRNVVSKAVMDASIEDGVQMLKNVKAAWRLPLIQRIGCPINGQALIDLWFNGELFHRDEDKRMRLEEMRARFGDDMVRVWLMIAFSTAHSVVVEFHRFLRERTDLYPDGDKTP